MNKEYIDAFVLESFFCKSCTNLIVQNAESVALCLSTDEVTARAETEHNNLTACRNPHLMIVYKPVLLHHKMYDEIAAVKVTPSKKNGN